MLLRTIIVAVLAFVCSAIAQKMNEAKGAPEVALPAYGPVSGESEVLARVESQLVGALQMLDALQEEPKIAEKRRNNQLMISISEMPSARVFFIPPCAYLFR
ncbi:unnamed protein product, partial [Mesorhabditis spiculigera]